MRTMNPDRSILLLVDFQARLMPAIEDGAAVVRNARRLREAAGLMGIPVVLTEQNPEGLGGTVPELSPRPDDTILRKTAFDACREAAFAAKLPDRPDVVVAGCETHVCVLQTALGLLDAGRRVFLVRDAVGSRRAESREAAIRRMECHGAEVVTAEMAVFEWLGSSGHPRFREMLSLVK